MLNCCKSTTPTCFPTELQQHSTPRPELHLRFVSINANTLIAASNNDMVLTSYSLSSTSARNGFMAANQTICMLNFIFSSSQGPTPKWSQFNMPCCNKKRIELILSYSKLQQQYISSWGPLLPSFPWEVANVRSPHFLCKLSYILQQVEPFCITFISHFNSLYKLFVCIL